MTLSTESKTLLTVESITLTSKSPDKKNKETESFVCPSFAVAGTENPTGKQTHHCGPGPHRFARVVKADIKVGAVGTSKDVYIEIGSDTNKVVCENKMRHLLGSEWKKNSLEKFDQSDFGDCGKTLFKVTIVFVQRGEQNNQPFHFISALGVGTTQDCFP